MSILDLPRPVAYVLGGGAAFGAVQVGMLRALEEVGMRPDLVVGTSVGSLNGAVVAHNPRGAAERLRPIWASMTTDAVFPGGWLTRLRTLQTAKGWISTDAGLGAIIEAHLPVRQFDGLALPYAAVVADFATGEALMVDEGDLRPAVMASCAIPGVFPPVQHLGRTLVDGGLVANVPVVQALRMGAASVVVLDCGLWGIEDQLPVTLVETMLRVSAMVVRQQLVHDLPLVTAQVPVVYLPGPYPMASSPLDFGRSVTLAASAYAAARPFLSVVHVQGPGLYGAPPLLADAARHRAVGTERPPVGE
jgi:NTE family protein